MEFVLTAILGLSDDPKITNKIIVELRKTIKELSINNYETSVEKFKINLFIEGNKSKTKDPHGVCNTRFVKASLEVSTDLIIKYNNWITKSDIEIRQMLAEEIYYAYQFMIERIEKQKLDINKTQLLHDLNDKLRGFKESL